MITIEPMDGSCLILLNKTFLQLHILFLHELIIVLSTGKNYSDFLSVLVSSEKNQKEYF